MKKPFFLLFILGMFLASCSIYRIEGSSIERDTIYGQVCETPTYVATMGLEPTVVYDAYGNAISTGKYTLLDCLNAAQEKFGNEVTIVNVRWDIKNKGKRKSAIFDVVKCK